VERWTPINLAECARWPEPRSKLSLRERVDLLEAQMDAVQRWTREGGSLASR